MTNHFHGDLSSSEYQKALCRLVKNGYVTVSRIFTRMYSTDKRNRITLTTKGRNAAVRAVVGFRKPSEQKWLLRNQSPNCKAYRQSSKIRRNDDVYGYWEFTNE